MTSPMKGDATLTDAQATDLAAGKMYFNLHTAANKDGALRGQVMKKEPPHAGRREGPLVKASGPACVRGLPPL